MASRLLSHALNFGQFDKSVRNCHVPGLDSISLFHDPRHGMIRFYFARAGEHQMDQLYGPDGHFTIGVHNHKYEIAKIPLMGPLINARTEVYGHTDENDGFWANTLFEYEFKSAIRDGEIGVSNPKIAITSKIQPDLLIPGDVVIMRPEDLHTVVIPRDHDSAWMVIEGPPVADLKPLIYSPLPDLSLDPDGLYEKMPEQEAIRLTEKVFEHVIA